MELPHAAAGVEKQLEQLMREIAQTADRLSDNAELQGSAAGEGPKGKLIIMGSGIASVGFTRDTEMHIKAADYVFYVVTDAVTKIWIKESRPDAYDLSALYSDSKPRYSTYMQMTEAMLYYVRQGKTVAAIYYGHPGVFALSTHRAVSIARREGHHAIMKPGISALDCLCADLGVDPSYPGMQTMEATDMLLRGKAPDTTMHVVLWQVGLVGVTGFRRRGYLNRNFNVLVEFLQQVYGRDYVITHYIAAHYPTIPPIIERWKLSELLRPDVQAGIQGLSTFYIPPKDATECCVEMAVRIGMAKPGSQPWTYPAHKDIDRYDEREVQAIRELSNFRIPADYQHPERTRAADFMLELTHNLELQKLFERDPSAALSGDSFPGLGAWERRLLATRQPSNISCAVKGADTPRSPGEQWIIDLLAASSLVELYSGILELSETAADPEAFLKQWHESQGYPISVSDIGAALPNVGATLLLPWTGAYYCPESDLTLIVMSDSQKLSDCLIYLNNTRIRKYSFANATLFWSQEDGNPCHGMLTFSMPVRMTDQFARLAEGKIWRGDHPPEVNNFIATELPCPGQNMHEKEAGIDSGYGQFVIQLYQEGQWSPFYQLYDGGSALYIGNKRISKLDRSGGTVCWLQAGGAFDNGCLTIYMDPLTGLPAVSGCIWVEGASMPTADNLRGRWVPRPLSVWAGGYKHMEGQGHVPTPLTVSCSSSATDAAVYIGDQLTNYTFRNGTLHAVAQDGTAIEGTFQLAEHQQRCFVGGLIRGTVEEQLLSSSQSSPEAWCGRYGTIRKRKDGTFLPSSIMISISLASNSDGPKVELLDKDRSIAIRNVVYNPQHRGIAWHEQLNDTEWSDYSNAMIKFHADYVTGELMFVGMCWADGEDTPGNANWRGSSLWAESPVYHIASADQGMQPHICKILAAASLSEGSLLPASLWERWSVTRKTVGFCYGALRERMFFSIK
ncbi:SAM-dependent methyltransferase [Paenibacillus tarimensis]|nr:SAM-dependent methyltransferase [Paenibacillus tarimensis]